MLVLLHRLLLSRATRKLNREVANCRGAPLARDAVDGEERQARYAVRARVEAGISRRRRTPSFITASALSDPLLVRSACAGRPACWRGRRPAQPGITPPSPYPSAVGHQPRHRPAHRHAETDDDVTAGLSHDKERLET